MQYKRSNIVLFVALLLFMCVFSGRVYAVLMVLVSAVLTFRRFACSLPCRQQRTVPYEVLGGRPAETAEAAAARPVYEAAEVGAS